MIELKLTAIGNSLGVILPKEVLGRMKVSKGIPYSSLNLRTATGNSLQPCFEGQMMATRKEIKKRRSALRELAK